MGKTQAFAFHKVTFDVITSPVISTSNNRLGRRDNKQMAVVGEGDGRDGGCGGGSSGCRTLCYVGLDLSTSVRGVGLLWLAV